MGLDFFDLEFGGEDKRMELKSAVEEIIKPGFLIHLGATHTLPYAVCYEISRVFWGSKPGFKVVSVGGGLNLQLMVFGGLVDKIITSYVGDFYPSPSPSPVIQKSYVEGRVEYENWSLLSICQMLMAGALNVGFMPTNSISGSSMEENRGFKQIVNPFTGRKQGVLRELKPDISVYHGWCADKEGNTIVFNPSVEGVALWGAYASKNGVIVTVEKIVDSNFIRRHSYLVKIPGYLVRAVVELPFGAHPSALYVPESFGGGYAEDYDFIVEFREAARREETLEKWIDEWVLGVNHEKYLEKLGFERLLYLMGKARRSAWRYEAKGKEGEVSRSEEPLSVELMVLVGARKIAEKCVEKGYRVILAGIGDSNLAAWMANYMLKEKGYPIELVAEIGFYGYMPRPASPFVFNMANIPTCKGILGSMQILGAVMGREDGRSIGVLGAGQVDKHGNINSTVIPGSMYLLGSGGANDVASTAEEVVVIMRHSPLRLVERVPYVTAPGEKVTMLVTTEGVFEKVDGELTLTGYFPKQGQSKEQIIERIKSETGWRLRVSEEVREEKPPTLRELMILRYFDPDHNFLREK
ncbi:MAG: CoA-transferase [Candidatus Freyarchaeota archaeon]|nr:CoA-transferase [Candidatus Freyrarchaeum guaymaensis]